MQEIREIGEKYKVGVRYFMNLDFDKGEKLIGDTFANAIFENCYFSIDFSKTDLTCTKFLDCNLKCCNFSDCNLTDTVFENCALDDAEFKNAVIKNTILTGCYCYGQIVTLNGKTGELEIFKDPLIKDLYENVPIFNKTAEHVNDHLVYMVYGELSLKLFDNITKNDDVTDFTKQCFQFFNLIGDTGDDNIDNLLLVGVYEGLYANKKCNDIARQLLYGRNKDFYEYWMRNGNVRADY